MKPKHGAILGSVALALAAVAGSISHAAGPLESWEPIVYSPGTSFTGLAAGAGRVAAATIDGRIFSWPRTDPANRTVFSAPDGLRDIAYGAGRFVAVGENGLVVTSMDGLVWQVSYPLGDASRANVLYGNGIFLAGGVGGLMRSSDGQTWSVAASPGFGGHSLFFGGGLFFAPGVPDGPGSRSTYSTTDGLDWRKIFQASPLANTNLYVIGHAAGSYVAISTQKEIWTSEEAVNWEQGGTLADIERPGPFAEGNGYVVTVGGNGRAYSRDARNWTVVPSEVSERRVIFTEGVFIASGFEYVHQSQPVVGTTMAAPGELMVLGTPGQSYRIEVTESLGEGHSGWEAGHTFEMPASEAAYSWHDPAGTSAGARFYRVVTE